MTLHYILTKVKIYTNYITHKTLDLRRKLKKNKDKIS